MRRTDPYLDDRGHVVARAFLILKILLALLGLGAAFMNLAGLANTVAEFAMIGFGQWFRYVTGLWLLVGSILILLPRKEGIGAALLFAVCVGAFLAQLLVLHDDLVHTVVPAVLLAAITYMYRAQLTRPELNRSGRR